MPRKKKVDASAPRIEDNKIIIPVTKDKTFIQKANTLFGQYENVLDKSTKAAFNTFLDVAAIEKLKTGTQIPFYSTLYGNFLINPSSVSISTFQKMWDTDDIIRRCMELNISTIVDGVGEYYHEDKKIQDFIRYAFKKVDGGKDGLMRQILVSMWAGFWVGAIEERKDKDGYTYIKKVRQLPPLSVQFTATPSGDVDKIWQYVYNFPFSGTQNALSTLYGNNAGCSIDFFNNGLDGFYDFGIDRMAGLGDVDYPLRSNYINTFGLVELDQTKCMHFIFDRINGKINPYGYSWFRPIYDLWLKKTLLGKLYTSAMSRCANPMVVGFADASKVINTGMGSMQLNAVDALYQTMQRYTEESAIILPGLKGQMFDVEVVHSEGNFTVYDTAAKYYDSSIEKALGTPEGLFSSSSSYAGATAQNSIYTRVMDSIKNEIVPSVLCNQFVKYLIHENFGSDIEDFGHFENELQNIDDKLKYQKLYEGMTVDGYLSNIIESDIQRIRKNLGQPEYTAEELKIVIERNKEQEMRSKNDNSKKTNTKQTADHYTNRSTNENV